MLHLFNLNLFDTYEHRRKYPLEISIWEEWINKFKPDHITINGKLFVVLDHSELMYERIQAYCVLMDYSFPRYNRVAFMWDSQRHQNTLDAIKYEPLYLLTESRRNRINHGTQSKHSSDTASNS